MSDQNIAGQANPTTTTLTLEEITSTIGSLHLELLGSKKREAALQQTVAQLQAQVDKLQPKKKTE